MDYYELLDVAPDADFYALKKAYYRQAKKCHPDHFGNSPEKNEEFKRLVCAFNTLSDPDARAAYDSARRSPEGPAPESAPAVPSVKEPVMDSEADDILEELVVGNEINPLKTSLLTLFLDMRRTEVFMAWRSAESLYRAGRTAEALAAFRTLVRRAPSNILYQVYLARSHARSGHTIRAVFHYRAALTLGQRRNPPQHLGRVRRELERLIRRKSPLLLRVRDWFTPVKYPQITSETDAMIEEMNRAFARHQRRMRDGTADRNSLTE